MPSALKPNKKARLLQGDAKPLRCTMHIFWMSYAWLSHVILFFWSQLILVPPSIPFLPYYLHTQKMHSWFSHIFLHFWVQNYDHQLARLAEYGFFPLTKFAFLEPFVSTQQTIQTYPPLPQRIPTYGKQGYPII